MPDKKPEDNSEMLELLQEKVDGLEETLKETQREKGALQEEKNNLQGEYNALTMSVLATPTDDDSISPDDTDQGTDEKRVIQGLRKGLSDLKDEMVKDRKEQGTLMRRLYGAVDLAVTKANDPEFAEFIGTKEGMEIAKTLVDENPSWNAAALAKQLTKEKKVQAFDALQKQNEDQKATGETKTLPAGAIDSKNLTPLEQKKAVWDRIYEKAEARSQKQEKAELAEGA